jgi:molybdopterin synthase sulfur carrier subunit
MPTIWIPPQLRDLTNGKTSVRVQGKTIGQALDNLDAIYPGVRDRLCQGDDLCQFIAVVVDGQESPMGIYQPLQEGSEVRFLPMMEGG